MRKAIPSFLVFLVLTLGGGTLIGMSNLPGAWYAGLAKPSFTPPNWVFGPVWSVLYVMIAVAGWRAWQAAPEVRAPLLAAWAAQLVFNFLWSPLFFGAQRIGLALAVLCLMFAAIAAFIALAARRGERMAALLMLPYGAWVAFAGGLNASLYRLNA